MSGEPKEHDESAPAAAAAEETPSGSNDVIPVEVEAPDVVEVVPPPDPVAELETKLAAAEKEKKENWDRYLRGAADLENLRKRQKRETEDAKFETKSKVLKEMLPVVDNLERAIEHAVQSSEETNPIVEGVQLVLRQFTTAFERLEVTGVEAMGQPFDPNLHEAISQQESDSPPGTVVQVLQRGYKSGDRLLRPALVVVAKAKTSE
ncbi:MAG: nucleotide exchange factor GrpE [Deltaproteobacteria bacterium]|nr:nucleotide exchange factor GrpE [Deltaproteobacteria bacterium]